MAIIPIETYYKDYHFRSRLEARWAVFFDAIGVEYDYEPEGFRLGDYGYNYLPDFYLKRNFCYAEIKADDCDRVDAADALLQAFVTTTHKRILLLVGLPSDLKAVLYVWNSQHGFFVRTMCDWSLIPGFEAAARAAKQARFEWGQHGQAVTTRTGKTMGIPVVYQVPGR